MDSPAPLRRVVAPVHIPRGSDYLADGFGIERPYVYFWWWTEDAPTWRSVRIEDSNFQLREDMCQAVILANKGWRNSKCVVTGFESCVEPQLGRESAGHCCDFLNDENFKLEPPTGLDLLTSVAGAVYENGVLYEGEEVLDYIETPGDARCPTPAPFDNELWDKWDEDENILE